MQITVNEDHIALQVPYSYKHLCKSIPNGKWHRLTQSWIYPRSQISAYFIQKAFSSHLNSDDTLLNFCSDLFIEWQIYEEALQLKTKIWEHQMAAVRLARGREGSMFNFGMRSGKSLAAIAVMNYLQINLAIIACPKVVVGVWPKQFKLHSERKYHILTLGKGSTTERAKKLTQATSQPLPLVVIVNYDAIWREDLGAELLDLQPDIFIMDESHRIKAHTGKQQASKFCYKLAQRSKKRIALTGTPMPHSPLDLFGQFRAIDHNVFGQYVTPFKNEYTVRGGYMGKQILGFRNLDNLKEKFDLVSITRTSAECIDLPEMQWVDIPVEMSPKGRKVYDAMERDFIAWVEENDEAIVAKNSLSKISKLQQITSGHVIAESGDIQEIDTSKIDALSDILIDHGKVTKVVVVCVFKADLKAVRELCDKIQLSYGELSGSHNDLNADGTIKDEYDVMGVQIQSGNMGVDLSKADILVGFSVGLSRGDWDQMCFRLVHPDHKNKIAYYKLIATKTYDEKIFAAFKKQENVVNQIVGEIKSGIEAV